MGARKAGDHLGDDAIVVRVNGERHDLRSGTTVEAVVRLIAPEARGIAVALNGEVVPRSAWSASMVATGDEVEILTAAQGG